jgi:hypothetical protein
MLPHALGVLEQSRLHGYTVAPDAPLTAFTVVSD